MSLKPLKITFDLDGTGVYYDRNEPLHLDALLAWALAPFHCKRGEVPTRDSEPTDIPLPLGKWHMNGVWGWHASALFPEGETAESLQYWRKRFRQHRVGITHGSPNLQNGVYREYNQPMPLLLCHRMIAYALGDRRRIHQILKKQVKFLGKKRAYGKGNVIGVNVEWIEKDLSLFNAENRTMRWLPTRLKEGARLVRPRPPYWNIVGRVKCCEVGDEYV
jgi:hypothetical protein